MNLTFIIGILTRWCFFTSSVNLLQAALLDNDGGFNFLHIYESRKEMDYSSTMMVTLVPTYRHLEKGWFIVGKSQFFLSGCTKHFISCLRPQFSTFDCWAFQILASQASSRRITMSFLTFSWCHHIYH